MAHTVRRKSRSTSGLQKTRDYENQIKARRRERNHAGGLLPCHPPPPAEIVTMGICGIERDSVREAKTMRKMKSSFERKSLLSIQKQ